MTAAAQSPALSRPGERMVDLVDGRRVSSWSEEWRHECEAAHILAMPTKAERVEHLDLIELGNVYANGRRGPGRGRAAREALEATILALWQARRTAAA